jgi:hypothetical protein
VLQYVPDAVRDERINVGILVAGHEERFFRGRLLSKNEWGRLRRLGYDTDFRFLSDLQREFAAAALDDAQLPDTVDAVWTPDRMRQASTEWGGTIQVTAPRPVTHDRPAVLVTELYARFVADPATPRRRARDRRWINKRIRTGIRHEVQMRRPTVDLGEYLKPQAKVQGAIEEHAFDFMLMNGHPIELMKSLSLESVQDRARTEVDAIAWAIADLAKAKFETPVTVIAIGEGKLLDIAEHTYNELGATLVREPGIDAWLAASCEKLLLALGSDVPRS